MIIREHPAERFIDAFIELHIQRRVKQLLAYRGPVLGTDSRRDPMASPPDQFQGRDPDAQEDLPGLRK